MISAGVAVFVFILLAGVAWMIRYNQQTAPQLELAPKPLATPKISVLIPARNEAHNLSRTLPKLLQSHYPDWELLVLDDCSDDGTADVIATYEEQSGGLLRSLRGAPLPSGWNGKNWACAQLAEAAQGDILVFCDADVSVGPMALTQTVSSLQHNGAGVLTAIPHQQLVTWSEQAIVPLIMHLSTLGSVPLRIASSSLRESLTVANGQWLAFSRAAYRTIGGHASVKASIVEDMVLCKKAKRKGIRVVTVMAFSEISVRMYDSFRGIREGFSKNLFGLVQYRLLPFVFVGTLFAALAVAPWVMPFVLGGLWWLTLPMLLGVRVLLAYVAGHPTSSVLLHPIGSVLLMAVGVESFWRTLTRRLSWKERTLVRPTETPLSSNELDSETNEQKASLLLHKPTG
ncbi:MAG: glycosyltransferase [Deltaproteobacteria bacterium]|nr:MAG: glycosyltransferase [Deltaproteobacteria bacterium]